MPLCKQALLGLISTCLSVKKKNDKVIPDWLLPLFKGLALLPQQPWNTKTITNNYKTNPNFMFRIQLLIVRVVVRVCEPVELKRLECFCALSDLLTYVSEICYFLRALPVQRFPSLASRMETPNGPRRAEVSLSLSSRAQGPLSIQLAPSPHPPPLCFKNNTKATERLEWIIHPWFLWRRFCSRYSKTCICGCL